MINKIFKVSAGFIIIVFIQFLCNMAVKSLHILLPAPVLGIIVFAILMKEGIIKKEFVKDVCDLLLKYMSLLFVPLFVGIVAYYEIIEKSIVPVLILLLFTATITMITTGLAVENIIKFVKLESIRKKRND